ncbi:Tetratricopeptide repeat protein 19, mitochondrial [Homalodisca vitripennis]|nr:Tetratricopeptide repeat protein 19, mitochondrial [Homalodisca vitripennis]
MSSNLRRVSQYLRCFIPGFQRQFTPSSKSINFLKYNTRFRAASANLNNGFHSQKVCFNCEQQHQYNNRSYGQSRKHCDLINSKLTFVTLAGIFSFFQTKEDEEESELIMTIKRAVLMIQHDEFKGAEQMLHVALRLAQQTQNSDGITYIHDLLANVAFAQGELDKAEVLFKDVMQRVLSQGTPQDDLKIIHMSLKLAKIYEQKHDWPKAEEGYKFCMKHLDKQVQGSEDEDVLMLWGMTLDWYARFLHEQNRLEEAFTNYKKAYEMCVRLNGEVHEQTVILLNDLGTISFLRGDNDSAIYYMTKAVETGRHLPNMEDFSSVYVNLGSIYMQKEMYEEAQKSCKEGLKNAKRHKNEEGLKEATICLEELKNFLKK